MNKALTEHEFLLKRLKFRSWHRGWKETDLILGSFADDKLPTLSPTQLDTYAKLLDLDDDIIWNWIIGKNPPEAEFVEIIGMLKEHAGV